MIQLPQGFKVNSREAIDVRLILSRAEMRNIDDSTMPDTYFAICKDDGKLYIYKKTNDILEDIGKYRVYAGNKDGGVNKISVAQGNILTEKEDGLYAPGTKAIGEEIIYSLFSSEKEVK